MGYRKKQEKNKGIYITITILVSIAIIYLFLNIKDTLAKYRESKKRLMASEQLYQELETQYQDIQKLKEFENSQTGYEMNVRSKFGLIKEGEQVVSITNQIIEPVEVESTKIEKFLNTFKNLFN